MGKKRQRKSKSRKKRPRRESSSGVAPEASDSSATEGQGPEATDDEPSVEGDVHESVDAVIELEDDLDTPEARAALIAAAAGLDPDALAEGDDGADGPEQEPPSTVDSEGGPPDDDTAPDPAPEAEPGTEPEGSEAPLIGPDALLALSEFRQEGVATLAEELVLDLGDATSPEERDRLLAAALAHVEMQEAIYRVPVESGTSRRWKGLVAAALFLAALFLTALPPDLLVPRGPSALTSAEEARGVRQALLLQAQQIEAFRATADRLPRALGEVETALPGIRFVRSSDRLYQLIAYTSAGDAIVYDSSAPDPAFRDIGSSWLSTRGDS